MIFVHATVSGKVQGVFYRAQTHKKAQSLGLTGYVKNLLNGQVEVVVCGDQREVDQLIEWLWQGPSAAEVSDVQCETATPEDVNAVKDFLDFKIL
jgi:acylphosphatase